MIDREVSSNRVDERDDLLVLLLVSRLRMGAVEPFRRAQVPGMVVQPQHRPDGIHLFPQETRLARFEALVIEVQVYPSRLAAVSPQREPVGIEHRHHVEDSCLPQ